MNQEKVLLFTDQAMVAHDPGIGHPERPQRLSHLLEQLQERLPEGCGWSAPRPADRSQLARVHAGPYLDRLAALEGQSAALDPDTSVSPGSYQAALLAAGAGLTALDSISAGTSRQAMTLVRPPGHHAEADRAMGFCLLNNVAIAARHATEVLGFERVLVIDWDVHHGNGTQHIFDDQRNVLYFSSHQSPFYPGTGAATETGTGPGEGFTVNLPLPPGLGDEDLVCGYQQLLVPIADQFAPDLVLVSAGYDMHSHDPIGGMQVREEGFARLTSLTRQIADDHAEGRLVLMLEGGYDLPALVGSVQASLAVLAGTTPPPPGPGTPTPPARAAIHRAREVQTRYWRI